ncbi:UDP-N-acetylmuramoyl-L-alanyl-D-glutamate--2,6-diaminopimelate ligase [Acidipropionibacterium virtanenii]|uniref:UDP-N-acetylmuramoyl-L-alanyl-D-glutamate--2,6-diaminopimelate ligase n=1 Tax=Acidipropionibacterium virtanenii TaxID=2057246 RepID=A0A344UVA0_9ACTN|nr:UDP-N-acetylmuramoyl-L-alanyl-D-glutamate--2,6-diaminopimelate ligase [Acidipropionibacterium virtanenii]
MSPDTSHLLRPASVGITSWERLETVLGQPSLRGALSGPGVSGITLDSRQVVPGDLYVGLPGTRFHGASFAAGAVAQGAAAVLTDAHGEELVDDPRIPVLVVADPRVAMARASALIFGNPTGRMTMYGITGTNGKTTTAFLVEAGLRAAGLRTGTIGTIGYRLDGRPLPSARTTITTPESPDLQALFATMAEAGASDTVMEVSSHALAMHRVDGTRFDVAAFTNLGRDHLDFHKTMEAYFQAKARLFTADLARAAVINVDDEHGRRLAGQVAAEHGVDLITTSIDAGSDYRVASWHPEGGLGSRILVDTPTGRRDLSLSLPGEFNVRNAVMALAMLERAGHGFADVVAGLERAQVPGRMERVEIGAGAPEVLVDFAHTPQAIGSALAAARTATGGRLIAVLGAGGDRDSAKRGPMGSVAAQLADVVVVTDDNPRTEDPAAIRTAVLAGARRTGGAVVVDGGDRRSAIREALAMADDNDLVAVLGKGHETGQSVGDRLLDFDDRVVTGQEWARLHGLDGSHQEEDITA